LCEDGSASCVIFRVALCATKRHKRRHNWRFHLHTKCAPVVSCFVSLCVRQSDLHTKRHKSISIFTQSDTMTGSASCVIFCHFLALPVALYSSLSHTHTWVHAQVHTYSLSCCLAVLLSCCLAVLVSLSVCSRVHSRNCFEKACARARSLPHALSLNLAHALAPFPCPQECAAQTRIWWHQQHSP